MDNYKRDTENKSMEKNTGEMRLFFFFLCFLYDEK